MTVAVDDLNLKSLEKDDQTHQCESNGQLSIHVEPETDDVEPPLFPSKGNISFLYQ